MNPLGSGGLPQDGLSVVVPVFNSERTLASLVQQVHDAAKDLATEFELILVDDGSHDGSWAAIEAAAAELPSVRGVRLARNFGEHNAVLCGIGCARHSVVVTMDDDLQQPPSEIQGLLKALTPEVDVVYGVSSTYRHSLFRRASAWFAKLLLAKFFGVRDAFRFTSFRAIRREIFDPQLPSVGPYFSLDVLIRGVTSRITSVEVRHDARVVKGSGYTMPKLWAHTANMIAGSSPSPLFLAIVVGVVLIGLACAGLLASVLLLALATWRSAAYVAVGSAAVAIFGVGLASLGILGDYAARILTNSSGVPSFVVRSRTGESGG